MEVWQPSGYLDAKFEFKQCQEGKLLLGLLWGVDNEIFRGVLKTDLLSVWNDTHELKKPLSCVTLETKSKNLRVR